MATRVPTIVVMLQKVVRIRPILWLAMMAMPVPRRIPVRGSSVSLGQPLNVLMVTPAQTTVAVRKLDVSMQTTKVLAVMAIYVPLGMCALPASVRE